jgi:hypothetical protein
MYIYTYIHIFRLIFSLKSLIVKTLHGILNSIPKLMIFNITSRNFLTTSYLLKCNSFDTYMKICHTAKVFLVFFKSQFIIGPIWDHIGETYCFHLLSCYLRSILCYKVFSKWLKVRLTTHLLHVLLLTRKAIVHSFSWFLPE